MGKGDDPHCARALPFSPEMPDGAGEIRLWLDDDLADRKAWPGWTQVTNVEQALALINTGRVVEMSLDHDLGDDEVCGKGIELIDYLAEQQTLHGRLLWPRDGITLHSANSGGVQDMIRCIKRYAGEHYEIHQSLTSDGKPRLRFVSG